MKIVRQASIPIQTCRQCGCQVKLKVKDFKKSDYHDDIVLYQCPVCRNKQKVSFVLKGENNNA